MAFALLNHTEEKTTIDEILTGTFKEKDRQINFAIEELEKIKTEIQGLIDFEESCCGNTTLGYQCLGVIDDKISELKGE